MSGASFYFWLRKITKIDKTLRIVICCCTVYALKLEEQNEKKIIAEREKKNELSSEILAT